MCFWLLGWLHWMTFQATCRWAPWWNYLVEGRRSIESWKNPVALTIRPLNGNLWSPVPSSAQCHTNSIATFRYSEWKSPARSKKFLPMMGGQSTRSWPSKISHLKSFIEYVLGPIFSILFWDQSPSFGHSKPFIELLCQSLLPLLYHELLGYLTSCLISLKILSCCIRRCG